MLTNGGGNPIGDLLFHTRNGTADAALTERMRILSTGNVGVGTSAPGSKFEVVGGTVSIKGQYASPAFLLEGHMYLDYDSGSGGQYELKLSSAGPGTGFPGYYATYAP